ncbi:MAG TPA: DUF1801 domain-containing protein [Thermoanaerobaculia bacterium]|jgi:hypothetical protein
MAKSNATTVEAYLDELPEERREVVAKVRELVQRNLPKGYKETVTFGMITWCVPLERYPDTYNKQPLGYVALAAQKNYYALYLMNVYADSEQEQFLREEYRNAGKKLDIGKSCLRFKKLEDLQPEAVGKIIAATTPEEFIARYEAIRAKK